MITVGIYNFGDYPIDPKKIQQAVTKTLVDGGVSYRCETSVAIVSKEKMQEYVDLYYGHDGVDHPVLSFPQAEVKGQFVLPPDGINHLGEIVVSYPWAKKEATKTGKDTSEIVCELCRHGALHLLGIHHD